MNNLNKYKNDYFFEKNINLEKRGENKQTPPKKKISFKTYKKNTINSLNQVEHFLRNFKNFTKYIKLYKIFK